MSKVHIEDLGYSQIPHYCTHAIEAFSELALELPRRLGLDPDFELLLCDLMKDSIHFVLPDNGFLLAEHDFKPAMFDLLRLPYPACALEFTATQELYAADSGLAFSAKRIALCFDPHQLAPAQLERLNRLIGRSFLGEVPENCLAVMAVYEANGNWGAATGVVLIDLENDRPLLLKDAAGHMDDITERIGVRLNSKKTAHGLPARFLVFPARAQLMGVPADVAMENFQIDTIDEVRTVYEFLAAINCSNVGTQDLAAPRMLNEKRKKKGRVPFFAYKILDISPIPAAGTRPGAGGNHASPKTHLRRGHLRQLGERFENKVLWINATMVNAKPGSGPVTTVYKVKGQA